MTPEDEELAEIAAEFGQGIKKRRPKKTDLDKLQIQSMTILTREIGHLMDKSFDEKLDANNSKVLVDYIKLINELKKSRDKELEEMTDEQLLALKDRF